MKSSPFDVFRRNQREFMVVLTLLSIFAFVFLDNNTRRGGEVPPSLGAILVAFVCGGGLWWVGRSRAKGTEFGLWGLVIGGLVGYIGLNAQQRGTAAVTTSANVSVSNIDLERLRARRMVANQFVSAAMQKTKNFQPFSFGEISSQAMVGAYVLEQEARKQGLKLTDSAVNDFVKKVTGDKLSLKDFKEILSELRIGEGNLFEALRGELEGNLAARLGQPPRSQTRNYVDFRMGFQQIPQPFPRTPAQYWDYFRRISVKEELVVVPVPVEDFVAEVPEPSDKELNAFFEKYKAIPAGGREEDHSPGFLQPPKVALAWLSAEFSDFEKVAGKSTEEELRAYYESHKSQFREKAEELKPVTPTEPPKTDDTKTDAPKSDGDSKPAPKEEAKPDADGKPKTDAPAETKPAPEKANPEKPAEPQPDKKPETAVPPQSLNSKKDLPIKLVSFADDSKPAENAKPAAETKPAEETKPAGEKPADAKPPADDKAADPLKTDEPPKTPPVAPTLPKPGDSLFNSTAPIKGLPDIKPEPRIRPFDEVRDEVDEKLLKEKAFQKMGQALQAAYDDLKPLAEELLLEADAKKKVKLQQNFVEEAKKVAERLHLKPDEAPAKSQAELFDLKKFPLGRAVKPSIAANATRASFVAEEAFQQRDSYQLNLADSSQQDVRYLWWKTADVPSQTPKLTDPEIREQVVEGYKWEEARKLAEARGKELKAAIEKEKGDVAAVISGQSVTGKKEGSALKILEPAPFSWLTVGSSVPQNQFMADRTPRLSTVPGLEGAAEDFMQLVFDKLNVGEVGVGSNFSRSQFYVVQVKSRDDWAHADEVKRQAYQNEFLGELGKQFRTDAAPDFFSMQQTAYDMLADRDAYDIDQKWQKAFRDKFGTLDSPESSQ